ncbi:Fe-S cluster assembly protein SufD [Candidatus Woesearchaeota archaeon]|jgi:FeS assembly protein SufD|nr:Fe-S cluster assembly protein SufD [Candidatus Woesearchaeota archaeon]
MEITTTQFKKFAEQITEPEWFTQYRLNSFLNSQKTNYPTFRYGLNIKIEPSNFNFSGVTPKHIQNSLIKIDYDKNEAEIFSSNQLDFSDESKIKPFLTKDWVNKEDENKIFYFNQAFANDFLFINIPKNTELNNPIEINYDINDSTFISNIFILAEKNTKAKIILNKSSQENSSYISETVKIIAEENSKIDFITIQNLNNETINIQDRKSIGKRDSQVNWIDLCLGTQYTKSQVISNLNEPGADTNNTILFLGSGSQQYDLYTASLHNAKNTTSKIITKGVLNNESKALSRSLVKIKENAPKSNGYEKQEALLLSENAEADAIPYLEIDNNDVKCSHSSAVGQIDKDVLFYMMSRGLNESEAKKKIIEGYFSPILELLSNQKIQDKINEKITNSLR